MLTDKRMTELDRMSIEEKEKADLTEEERFYILRGREMFSTIPEDEKKRRRKQFLEEAPDWFKRGIEEHS